MALATIEIDVNEYELYDFTVSIAGEPVAVDSNYTTSDRALAGANEAIREWYAAKA